MREKIKKSVRRMREKMRKRRLVVALGLAIFASLVLTAVSLTIYKVGDYYRYDLSRPGYESERSNVVSTTTTITYDTSSAFSKEDIDSSISEFDGHTQNISKYNTFGDSSLSDEDLQLTTTTSQ